MGNQLDQQGPIKWVAAAVLLLAVNQGHGAEGPWRLNDALGLDNGFSLSGSFRTRMESINDGLRLANSPSDDLLTFLTFVEGQYNNGGFGAQLELIDARQSLADVDSIFGTDSLNALDVLQANVSYRFTAAGDTTVKLGRFTENWGSRRLLARHRYGNNTNSFDGIWVRHVDDDKNEIRAIATRPTRKLPSDRASLRDNRRVGDKSSDAQKFYGLYVTLPQLSDAFITELQAYSLQEKDTPDLSTRNRRINSFGFRLLSTPAPGRFHFETETVLQTGTRRATTAASDLKDLDHQSLYQYAMVGYSFDVPSRLQVWLEYSYAGGDEDPFDLDSGDFDSLFGVTTPEFAPTGMYGIFDRSNVSTPGIRVTGNLSSTVDLMFSYRHLWLAEARDTWGRTGRRDVTGESGSYLGQQLEGRLRWDVVPGNVRIETGGVIFNTRNLADTNTLFGYLAATFTF